MLETIRQSLKTGIVTTNYPKTPPEISSRARGKPEIDWVSWKDARPAAKICPTGAISYDDANGQRLAQLDLGKCIFCGLCADVDSAIRMTSLCECAAHKRTELVTQASYSLKPDGAHDRMASPPSSPSSQLGEPSPVPSEQLEQLGRQIKTRAGQLFGRSLHIRQVDAGS